MDVFETEESIAVRVEVSGVRGEDIRVSVDGEMLRISGERLAPTDKGIQRLHQMEIAFGPFERSLRIQIPFDANAVSARLEDGFLTVVLPKRGARRVEVVPE